jgi:hypothetical protein
MMIFTLWFLARLYMFFGAVVMAQSGLAYHQGKWVSDGFGNIKAY